MQDSFDVDWRVDLDSGDTVNIYIHIDINAYM